MSAELKRALECEDLDRLLAYWRRGGAARRRLVAALAADGALRWAERLSQGGEPARRLAAAVVGQGCQEVEQGARLLQGLVADPDRRVRELAVRAAGDLLINRFSDMFPQLGAWRGAADPLVRRAVPLAAAVGTEPGHLNWGAPLLELIEPLLADRAPQVRAVLGPAVLAGPFLATYPDDTFEYLAHWSTSHDEQVLWHVAHSLSGPPAAKLVRKSLILLRRLALDGRGTVQEGVVAALRGLGSLAPDPVGEELRRWLGEEERAPVARAALQAMDTRG
ncbi:MAG: hypothetical protein ACP5G2_02635 [Candidatus Bipolaricaulaceae bacterium]